MRFVYLADFKKAIEVGIEHSHLPQESIDKLRALGTGTYNSNFTPHHGGNGCPLTVTKLVGDPVVHGMMNKDLWEFVRAFDSELGQSTYLDLDRTYEVI